jgi:hypothetical protein
MSSSEAICRRAFAAFASTGAAATMASLLVPETPIGFSTCRDLGTDTSSPARWVSFANRYWNSR